MTCYEHIRAVLRSSPRAKFCNYKSKNAKNFTSVQNDHKYNLNMVMNGEGDCAIYVVHYMRWFDGEMVVYKIDEV
jgi:hypothetical protein